MKVTAITTVYLGAGKSQAPGSSFEMEDKDARDLIKRKAVRPASEPKAEVVDQGDGKGAPQK